MPFKKGESGNPGGRPKEVAEIKELAREHGEDAIRTIAEIMSNTKAHEKTRLAAAVALLDRGYGRPTQTVAGEDGGPAVIILDKLTKPNA